MTMRTVREKEIEMEKYRESRGRARGGTKKRNNFVVATWNSYVYIEPYDIKPEGYNRVSRLLYRRICQGDFARSEGLKPTLYIAEKERKWDSILAPCVHVAC